MGSLQIIKHWVESEHLARPAARNALVNLRQRGSYFPGRNHQLRTWWEEFLSPTGFDPG